MTLTISGESKVTFNGNVNHNTELITYSRPVMTVINIVQTTFVMLPGLINYSHQLFTAIIHTLSVSLHTCRRAIHTYHTIHINYSQGVKAFQAVIQHDFE